jgi:hypothetical protein
MTKMDRYAVINDSTVVSDADVQIMYEGVKNQMWYQVCPAWNRRFMDSVFVPKGGTVPTDCYPIYILDNADVAGALGYHTEDPGGSVYGRIFAETILSAKGTVLDGSLSVSACLSHEAIEFFIDKHCDLWAQYNQTHMVAYEACDPVENDSYTVKATVNGVTTPVAVSNFVLDAWFDAQSTAPGTQWDFMKHCTAPLTMTTGGYVVLLDCTTNSTSQQFGSREAEALHNLVKPAHPAARSSRRAR